MATTVLKVSTDQHKVALEAVGDAFSEFSEIINLSSHKFFIDGPSVGSLFSIELMGTVAEAIRRAKHIRRSVKTKDGPPPTYRQLQARDPNCKLVAVFLNGDKNGHMPKLGGVTKRLCAFIKSKHPDLQVYSVRSEGFPTINYKKFVAIKLTPSISDLVWNPTTASQYNVDLKAIKKQFLEGENLQWCR